MQIFVEKLIFYVFLHALKYLNLDLHKKHR